MAAYYNEFDPYAAQWLRNLIAAGHIAPGDVDERSIKDVKADDLKGYTQAHFFAGIGGWSYALRSAGWPDDRPVWTGSCPCQPFSVAGFQGGFDDERHLWPAWQQLISERSPTVVFGEQVAAASKWLDLVRSDLEKWVTPWGQSLSKPRAQTRIISGIDIGLWPTVTSNAKAKGYNEAGNSAGQVAIRKIILALWPTATTPSGGQVNPPGTSLTGVRPDGTKATVTLKSVVISLWSTLRASDGEKGGPNMSFGAGGSPLPSQVSTVANMSNAPVENGGGSLHPEFAGWELDYPPEWLNCAPLETRSTGARRRSLSKRMRKPVEG